MARSLGTPIIDLQQMLRVIYPDTPLNPDGVFGSQTQAAVRRFQRDGALPVTGVVDLATWDGIYARYEQENVLVSEAEPLRIVLQPRQIIEIGSKNMHLYVIQALLKALSRYYSDLPPLDVTGVLDARTAEAIRQLQTRSGLPVTGALDKLTWQSLVTQYRLTVGDGTARFPTRKTE